MMDISEARSRFSELISRAVVGERFLIRRRNRPVAVLIGSAELARLERLSKVARRLAIVLGQDVALLDHVKAGEIRPAVAAFGLWSGAEDPVLSRRVRVVDRDGAYPWAAAGLMVFAQCPVPQDGQPTSGSS